MNQRATNKIRPSGTSRKVSSSISRRFGQLASSPPRKSGRYVCIIWRDKVSRVKSVNASVHIVFRVRRVISRRGTFPSYLDEEWKKRAKLPGAKRSAANVEQVPREYCLRGNRYGIRRGGFDRNEISRRLSRPPPSVVRISRKYAGSGGSGTSPREHSYVRARNTPCAHVIGHFAFSFYLTLERKSGSDLGRHGDFKDVLIPYLPRRTAFGREEGVLQ